MTKKMAPKTQRHKDTQKNYIKPLVSWCPGAKKEKIK